MKNKGENIIGVLETFVANTESLKGARDVLSNKNQDCSMSGVLDNLKNLDDGVDDESALGLVLKARANLSRLIFIETFLKNDIRPVKELDSSLNKLQNILLRKDQTIKSEDFLYVIKNAHLYYLDGIIGNIGNKVKLNSAEAEAIFENAKIIPNDDFPKYQCTDKILYLKQKGTLSNLTKEELNKLGGIGKKHINNEKSDSERWCKAHSGLMGIYALMFLFTSAMAVSTGSHLAVWVSISVVFAACAMITAVDSKYDYANYKLGEYKLNAFKVALPFDIELYRDSRLKALSSHVTANEFSGNMGAGQVNEKGSYEKDVSIVVEARSQGGGSSSMTLKRLDN